MSEPDALRRLAALGLFLALCVAALVMLANMRPDDGGGGGDSPDPIDPAPIAPAFEPEVTAFMRARDLETTNGGAANDPGP